MQKMQAENTPPVLQLAGVGYTYTAKKNSVQALQGIDLTVKDQEFLCVLGPSGCGKSTLLSLIAGFLAPTTGTLQMQGQLITGPSWARGVVFQAPTLYAWLSVRQNIGFGLKMRHFKKQQIEQITSEYIELVGLQGFEDSKPYELSGGMKQRVALARALVGKPRVLLMDEPFGALDALTRQSMQALVRRLWQATQCTVVLVTHDIDEALCLGTRTLLLSGRPGHILQQFEAGFTHTLLQDEKAKVVYQPDYIARREELLAHVTGGQ